MTNAELIKALRCDGTCRDECPYSNGREWCDEDRMIKDAADALEAADIKIADYTAAVDALDDSNDAYIKENERLKKRIAELERILKAVQENSGINFRLWQEAEARMRTVTDCHTLEEVNR